jgi:low affinity Fe/Cu permease
VKRSVVIIALPFSFVSKAQSFLKIIIKAGEKPLQGASVQWQQGGSSFQTDSTGLVLIQNIPAGKQTFVISHVGFEEKTTELIFPRSSDKAIEIEIEQEKDEHEEEVIIRTKRDNTTGRSYWITGLMGEKLFRKISVFINFENFTDTRQTKFGSIYNGSIDVPVFKDIYAPVEGFVVNGGFKLRL